MLAMLEHGDTAVVATGDRDAAVLDRDLAVPL
jgi:hypothetical protein